MIPAFTITGKGRRRCVRVRRATLRRCSRVRACRRAHCNVVAARGLVGGVHLLHVGPYRRRPVPRRRVFRFGEAMARRRSGGASGPDVDVVSSLGHFANTWCLALCWHVPSALAALDRSHSFSACGFDGERIRGYRRAASDLRSGAHVRSRGLVGRHGGCSGGSLRLDGLCRDAQTRCELVAFVYREQLDDADAECVGDLSQVGQLQVRYAAFDFVDGGSGDARNACERRNVHSRLDAQPLDVRAEESQPPRARTARARGKRSACYVGLRSA